MSWHSQLDSKKLGPVNSLLMTVVEMECGHHAPLGMLCKLARYLRERERKGGGGVQTMHTHTHAHMYAVAYRELVMPGTMSLIWLYTLGRVYAYQICL